MKKVLLTFLVVIVIAGALVGAGFAGYHIGVKQGAASSDNLKFFERSERVNPNGIPRDFGRHFDPRIRPHNMIQRGGFGLRYFSPLHFLWNTAVLALIIWFAYGLFTKSGWQVTRKMDTSSKPDSNESAGN
jgi:hypothetical protein